VNFHEGEEGDERLFKNMKNINFNI